MPKPKRHASDHQERVEWQLNQIRVNTLIVALFALLAMLGGLLSLLAAAGA